MKHLKLLFGVLLTSVITFSSSHAQFNPYSDVNAMATVGIGVSGWGIPFYGRFEKGITDNISIGGQISYQSDKEEYSSFGFTTGWRHTIIGLSARGNYHFNEILNIGDGWDLYSGASLGYYIWNTKTTGDDFGESYRGSGSGGLYLGFQVGGRYFINEKFAINAEFGRGTVLGSGMLGLTILL